MTTTNTITSDSDELELQRAERIQRHSVVILEMTRERTEDLMGVDDDDDDDDKAEESSTPRASDTALLNRDKSEDPGKTPMVLDGTTSSGSNDITTKSKNDKDNKAKEKINITTEEQDRQTRKEQVKIVGDAELKSGRVPGAVSDPNPPVDLEYWQSAGNAAGKPVLREGSGQALSARRHGNGAVEGDVIVLSSAVSIEDGATIANSVATAPVEARAITAGDLEEEVRARLKEEAVSAEPVKGENTSKKLYLLVGIVLVIVVAAVTGIAVSLGSSGGGEEEEDSAIVSPEIGTEDPSSSPTLAPLTEEEQALFDLLEEQSGADALALRATPQFKAFTWMAENGYFLDDGNANEEELLQIYGLATLYHASTSSNEWTDDAGWLDPSVPVCDWYPGNLCEPWKESNRKRSLQLDGNSSVSILQLDLSGNSLMGELPAEIGLLTSLQYLNLSKNKLDGPLPEIDWTVFTSLVGLDLHGNNLGDVFSSSWLKDLNSLRFFDISENNFQLDLPEDLRAILPLIQEFIVNGNQYGGRMPTTYPENLQVMQLQDIGLTGEVASSIWELPLIKEINIGFNSDLLGSVPHSIFSKEGLQSLNVAGLGWTGVFPDEVTLKILDLSGNSLGSELPVLDKWNSLVSLRLDDMGLSGTLPPSLFALTNLRELSISFNAGISGFIPTTGWEDLVQLEVLQLRSLSLVGTIPLQLFEGLRNLLVLELDENELNGRIPDQLGDLARLARLNLNGNALAGSIPASLDRLNSLESFKVSNNLLTGVISLEFLNPNELLIFDVSQNALNGTIPESTASFVNLHVFDISDNNLSGELPEELSALTSLKTFNVSYNTFTGRVAREFSTWTSIETIGMQGNDLFCEIPKSVCDMVRTPGRPGTLSFVTDCSNVDEEGNNAFFCPCCTICCTGGEDCEVQSPSDGGGGGGSGGQPGGGSRGPPRCALRPGGPPGGGDIGGPPPSGEGGVPLSGGSGPPPSGGGSGDIGGPPPSGEGGVPLSGGSGPPPSGGGSGGIGGPPPSGTRQLRTRGF